MNVESSKIKLIEAEGYTFTKGGVCAPKGFRANGLHCGLNPDPEKYDLALLVSDTECDGAAVYTTNKVKGAPLTVTKEHLAKTGGKVRALIANSKNANTCNENGIEAAQEMCEAAAKELGISADLVAVASTGVIGERMNTKPVLDHIKELSQGLTYDGGLRAEYAIMTTDTVAKEVAVTFRIGDTECHMGGMAKGSGMIHPNMATTLNFVTTDVAIEQSLMQKMLSEITTVTYNCLSVDGDTSTNDMILFMSNHTAGNEKIVSSENHPGKVQEQPDSAYGIVYKALWLVLVNLTRMLADDGEGAGKMITCRVKGAKSDQDARSIARSIISSSLVKCAVFGEDANSGRIMCALGYADADVDVTKVDLDLSSAGGTMPAYRAGFAQAFDEEFAKEILSKEDITFSLDLHDGEGEGCAWGCDMTYDYVKINGDYRS